MKLESNKPLYLQLEAAIKHDIYNQKYKPGEKLPTEVELGEIYGVSKITVRKAMENLTNDSLVERIRGKGTFVSQKKEKIHLGKNTGFNDSFLSNGHSTKYKILNAKYIKADSLLSEKLQISLNNPVIYIERLVWEDLIPVGIDKLYVSESLYPDIISRLSSDRSLYQTLKEEYDVNSRNSTLEINGIVADIENSELLQCAIGDPLFQVEKVSYQSSGVPIHYSSSIVRCDRIAYVISIDDHVKVNEKKET